MSDDKIKAWYGPGGALVIDKPLPDTGMRRMDIDCSRYYGAFYMVGESMERSVAIKVAEALGLDFRGDVR